MKTFLSIVLGMLLAAGVVYADGFVKKGKAGSIQVELMSEKPLSTGDNYFTIRLTQNGKPVNNAVIACKVFMPDMPGMPYMESKNGAVFEKDGIYKTDLALGMTGTWQLRLYIDTPDGKKQLYKTSLIF